MPNLLSSTFSMSGRSKEIVIERGSASYGPFRTTEEAEAWRSIVDAPDVELVPLRSLYLGSVEADSAFVPVLDRSGVWTLAPAIVAGIDYGKLILEPAGLPRRSLDAEAVALATGVRRPEFGSRDTDRADEAHGGFGFPREVDVRRGWIIEGATRRCASGNGEIILFSRWSDDGDGKDREPYDWFCEPPRYLAAWRQDGRQTKDLWVLGAHDDPKCAAYAVKELSETYRHFMERRSKAFPDRQRAKVYAWEKPFFRLESMRRSLGESEANGLILEVWEWIGLPGKPPAVVFKQNGRKFSSLKGDRWEIWIAKGMENVGTVLHEAAHALLKVIDIKGPAHGAEFVSAAIALYETFGGMDRTRLETAATAAGVEFGVTSSALDEVLAACGPAAGIKQPSR